MRRLLAALCLLVGLSAEAQVRTVWTNQAATATSSAYDTGRAQHTNIQIIGSSVVGTVDIEKSNDCSTWTNHQTLTDPSNAFLTLPSWACTRLVFTRTSGTITLATIEPVRTGRNGTMVGATSSVSGVGGTVPPPQAGDEAKVLLGDGTWGAGGGGSGDVESVTLTGTAPVTVTGSPCASGACVLAVSLTNMAIGTDLQAYDADLTGLAGLGNGLPFRNTTWAVTTPTDNTVPYYTAAGGLLSTSITRESADVTSLRNGTSAQEFKLFATYSGAGANYEDFYIRTNSTTTWRIGTEKAGTGAARDIRFFPDGVDMLRVTSSNVEVGASLLPTTNNSFSLGSSSAVFRLLYHTYGQMGASSKALVDATATAVWQVNINNNVTEGGTLKYTIFATDGTDRQARSGTVVFSALNNGGTETCVFGTPNDVVNVTSGTLTVTWDCSAGTDAVLIRATADTSLASTTTFTCESRLDITSGNTTLTPQ